MHEAIECLKKRACVCVYTSNISMLKSIVSGLYIESKITLKLVVDDNR